MNNVIGYFLSVNNKKRFEYTYFLDTKLKNREIYSFDIYEKGRENDSKFSFMLEKVDDNMLKVIDLFPDTEKYYLGNKISISIILEAKKIFNKTIRSSSNRYPKYIGEMRFEPAEIYVWKPLVEMGLAKYNEEKDFYYTIETDL